jgi:hypothetical protein
VVVREHTLKQLLARIVVAMALYAAASWALVHALPPDDALRTGAGLALFLAFAGYLAVLTRPRLRSPDERSPLAGPRTSGPRH